jgi:hypothetical protein
MSNPLPPHLQSNQPLGADDAERAMRNAVFSAAPGAIEQRSLRKATPVANIPLPSQGLVYPRESGLCGQDTIDIKHMTPREEDILLNKAYARKGTIISELVKACLIDKAVDVDTLLTGDRTAILIGIRATGYGSVFKVKVTCPKCESDSDVAINLAELGTKDLDLTKVQQVSPNTNAFNLVLPVSGKTVTYKYLTGAEVDTMFASWREKLRQKLGAPSPITDRLLKQIVAVDGDTSRFAISDFVESMEGQDSLALRTHVDDTEPGVDMTHQFACDNPECEHKEVLGFSLDEHFFYPNAKR